jgi:hypothetical protein
LVLSIYCIVLSMRLFSLLYTKNEDDVLVSRT